MTHLAEKTKELIYEEQSIFSKQELTAGLLNEVDILFVSLPAQDKEHATPATYTAILEHISSLVSDKCYVIVYAENDVLPLICYNVETNKYFQYKMWLSIKKSRLAPSVGALPNETKGAVIFAKSSSPMSVCNVRLPYTYCPACKKTTKDYGGKKHLFHEYGTLMSDVWKDLQVDSSVPLPMDVIERIRDMFSTDNNSRMLSLNLWNLDWSQVDPAAAELPRIATNSHSQGQMTLTKSQLLNGDVLEELAQIESNSMDYIFVDPPYNIKKQYTGFHDAFEIEEYFSWCDRWLYECYRILKPGKFLSILNLPQWCVRHYAFLSQHMAFSSWITWEALSRPVRNIMPAHYAILTLHKSSDEAQPGPGGITMNLDLDQLHLPMEDLYCLRASCMKKREKKYKPITDLWTDVHRLKHNSQRYDHPCQLPPKLMQRLIGIYTNEDDWVLDCFNGVGTTTLSAAAMNRNYVGIELAEKYHLTASERHADLQLGLDPFRKNEIDPNSKVKNNEEKRSKSPNGKNGLSKKKVQLMIKELTKQIGRLPTEEDALAHLDIPKEFYDTYFKNWSEVLSAAKTTGMNENKLIESETRSSTQWEQIEILL